MIFEGRRSAFAGQNPGKNTDRRFLPYDLFFERDGAGAARGTLHAVAQLADIDLELADGAAEGIAVHAQFARGAALISAILLQNGEDESFLEFPHAFRVEDVAAIHLQNECFQLIFHEALSLI